MNDRRILAALLAIAVLVVAGFGVLYYFRPDNEHLEQKIKGLTEEVQGLRKVLEREEFTLRSPDGTVRTWNEPSKPIQSLAVLPLVSDQPSTEVSNMSQNLGTLLRDHLGIKVMVPDKDAEVLNPLAAGKMLGADAVLFGEAYLIPLLSNTEYVQVNLQEVATGKSIWSCRVILRKGGEKDRTDLPLRLQNFPSEVVKELSARWPKK